MKKERFLKELNELLKKYKVKTVHGWDSGEVFINFEDENISISYDLDLSQTLIKKIGKLGVWK